MISARYVVSGPTGEGRYRHHASLVMLDLLHQRVNDSLMRAGEIVGLTSDRIFLSKRYIRLVATKNGDSRNVPLSSDAVKILSLLLPQEGATANGPVFGLTGAILDALFRKYRDKAKAVCPELETVRFHDTRHETVSRLARKLDVLDLARMIGHRDIRSLMIYYNEHASDSAVRLD